MGAEFQIPAQRCSFCSVYTWEAEAEAAQVAQRDSAQQESKEPSPPARTQGHPWTQLQAAQGTIWSLGWAY